MLVGYKMDFSIKYEVNSANGLGGVGKHTNRGPSSIIYTYKYGRRSMYVCMYVCMYVLYSSLNYSTDFYETSLLDVKNTGETPREVPKVSNARFMS